MTWEPVDIVVVIFASALGIATVMASIIPMILKLPVSDKRSQTAAPVISAMIAAVALYIGAKVGAVSE